MVFTQIIDGHLYITTGTVQGSRTLSISSIDGDAQTISVTAGTHQLVIGSRIAITGTTNYNGTFSVNRVDSTTTFTIFSKAHNFASEATGTITVEGGYIDHNTSELVDIWFTKLDYNYDNSINLKIPNISVGGTGDEKPTKIKDLKRITESLNVAGYLADEDGSSAKTKRNNLLTLASSRNLVDATQKRALLIVWGTDIATDEQTVWRPTDVLGGAFIQKIMFSETGGYVGEAVSTTADVNPPERKIAIQLQLVRGKDI